MAELRYAGTILRMIPEEEAQAMIARAVAEERERCAWVAETFLTGNTGTACRIAKKIRSGAPPNELTQAL